MQRPQATQEAKTIGQLAEQSGVSARTLRYYEDIGVLAPQRGQNGYRLYGPRNERRLTQVMAMRACGLPLATIARLVQDPSASVHEALHDHLRTLRAQGESLRAAMLRTQAAIDALERIDDMKTEDAFEELKRQGLEGFEREYGQEARERYGSDAIEAANVRMMALTRDEWDAKELLEESIKVQLRLAMATGDAGSPEAQELACPIARTCFPLSLRMLATAKATLPHRKDLSWKCSIAAMSPPAVSPASTSEGSSIGTAHSSLPT